MKKRTNRKTFGRELILESLDPRLCLAGGIGLAGIDAGYVDHVSAHVSPWHNPVRPHDVNQDQRVTPSDALAVVNALNVYGARTLSDAEGESTAMIDVDGDSQLTAADCLAIVNELNDPSADVLSIEATTSEATTSEATTSEDPSAGDTTVDETTSGEDTSGEEAVDDDAVEDPPSVGGDCRGSHRPSIADVFARADTSDDGILTADELPAEVWERLSAADADASGGITLDELTAFRPEDDGHGTPHGVPGAGEIFARFDENSDGLLTADELPDQAWLHLSPADSDGDGAITLVELAGYQSTLPARDDFFTRLDTDGDGSLTQAELPEGMWERLASADADGLISSEELATFRPAPPSGEGFGQDGMGRVSPGRGMPDRGEPHGRGAGAGTMLRSGRGGR